MGWGGRGRRGGLMEGGVKGGDREGLLEDSFGGGMGLFLGFGGGFLGFGFGEWGEGGDGDGVVSGPAVKTVLMGERRRHGGWESNGSGA